MELADAARRDLVEVSLNARAALALPPTIADVVIAAQNDGSDSAADRQLLTVIGRLVSEGRSVRLFRPPQGIKDVNEIILEACRAGQIDSVVSRIFRTFDQATAPLVEVCSA